MALLSPVYSLIVPFLFIFAIPITIFATITTTLACAVLLIRVFLVYTELALAVVPYYLLGQKPSSRASLPGKTGPTQLPVRRGKRRSSSSSAVSAGSITPVAGESSIGATRDFEGVGGWRLGDPSDDDVLWTNINSRLELPADHVRRHRRSLTSGSVQSDGKQDRNETVMNTSRARTPPSAGFAGEVYSPQVPSSPRILKRTASVLTGASGSSGSSKGSSMLSMKQK